MRFITALAIVVLCGGICWGAPQYIVCHNFTISYVNDPKQIDQVVNLFRNQLKLKAPEASILGCKEVTRVGPQGGKLFGIGAQCGVRIGTSRFSALMCEDSGFGRLAWARWKPLRREEVIRFIENNCLPPDKR